MVHIDGGEPDLATSKFGRKKAHVEVSPATTRSGPTVSKGRSDLANAHLTPAIARAQPPVVS
jgi:hypothetical protein